MGDHDLDDSMDQLDHNSDDEHEELQKALAQSKAEEELRKLKESG